MYLKPEISTVDINAEVEEFPGLPNSVHGDTIKDPTFESADENANLSNSIWY